MRVLLCGMMGSGKSSVGQALSSKLSSQGIKINHIDLDQEIEKSAGLSVSRIFEKYGEKHFRALEAQALMSLPDNTVVSLGGGALENIDSSQVLSLGTLVYLKAEPETLFLRLSEGGWSVRPLLKDLKSGEHLKVIKSMMKARAAKYQLAQIVIEVDALTVEDVVNELIRKLGVQ